MDQNIVLLARAYHFAALAHEKQRRKGERGAPYINHLTDVAEMVARAVNGQDAPLVAAAVLHDTVEDTAVSEADLREAFGDDIASLVMEATDDKSLPKAKRKRLQIEYAPHASPRAKILKMADKISNLNSLSHSPPDWTAQRKQAYVEWALAVAKGLRGESEWLDGLFDEAVSRARTAID